MSTILFIFFGCFSRIIIRHPAIIRIYGDIIYTSIVEIPLHQWFSPKEVYIGNHSTKNPPALKKIMY